MTHGQARAASTEADGGLRPGPDHRRTLATSGHVLAGLYLALVPVHLVLLHGVPRVVMALVAAATSVLCLVAARTSRRATERAAERVLFVVCALPLVNSVLTTALTRQLESTAGLMLAIVGVAALNPRGRQVLVGSAASVGVWVVVVLVEAPFPGGMLAVTALQLAVACGVAAAVYVVRRNVLLRLTSAHGRLAEQVEELEELRASAEVGHRHFRGVFENSPVGIALADERGLLVEANQALCTLLGRDWAAVEGRSWVEFTHPADVPAHGSVARMISESPDGVLRVEKRYVRPTGEVRWGWLTVRHVTGPAGQQWTLAHVQDVTERRRTDEELLRSRERLRASVEIARATQEGRDPRPLVLGSVAALTRVSTVSLIEPIGDDQLVVTATSGAADLVGVTIDLTDASATTRVWQTGEPLFASATETHPLVSRELLGQSGASSLLWQPVGVDGNVTAILALGWAGEETTVSDLERASVEAIAAEAAMALHGERIRQQLERTVVTDSLTGLLNRRGWDEQTLALTRQARRAGEPFVIALADLDHFKAYNDTHGHVDADRALVAFAQQARRSLRVVDVIARWGGEEFAIALRATSGEEAAATLERLRRSAPEGLTCSIGYAEALPGETIGQCLSRADAALYRAKHGGRDRLERATPACPSVPDRESVDQPAVLVDRASDDAVGVEEQVEVVQA